MAIPNMYNNPTVPSYTPYQMNTQQNVQNMYSGLSNLGYERQDAMNNARVNQQNAANYAKQLSDYNAQLQNRANQQIESRQNISENMFANLMDQYQNDPMFSQLRGAVTSWMNDPGLSQSTLNRLKGQAGARAAADLAGSRRRVARSASRSGLSGAQVDDANWAAASRSNAALGRNLLDIDLNNEQMKQQQRAQAVGAGGSLLNNYYGGLRSLGGAYSNLLTSYNPQVAPLNVYDAMQQVYANPYYGESVSYANPYSYTSGQNMDSLSTTPASRSSVSPRGGYVLSQDNMYGVDAGGIYDGLPPSLYNNTLYNNVLGPY